MNDRWYKLDNAAKIFPPTTDNNDPQVFRFSVELKEMVDKDKLQEALDETIDDYPIFRSTLKKGFFWYYLEEVNVKPVVTEENNLPCEKINGELLCRITYYKKRINLEVYHALTDGTGTLLFLRSLVANYLNKKHHIKEIPILDTSSAYEKAIDSFKKYYQHDGKGKKIKHYKAYQIKDLRYPEDHIKIIEGVMDVNEILKKAKEKEVTLTVYLTALLIKSIISEMTIKDYKKEITIQVPVNLRKYFPSDTVRNFFNVIAIKYKVKENKIVLDDIIQDVDKQFKSYLSKDNLSKNMNSFSVLENILLVRLIPRVIKDFVLKIIYRYLKRYHTMTLSNVGIVQMPDVYSDYINLFDVFTSTNGVQWCMCSYKEKLVISFTSHFMNTDIEKNFFREISMQGIEVLINTNQVRDSEIDEEM